MSDLIFFRNAGLRRNAYSSIMILPCQIAIRQEETAHSAENVGKSLANVPGLNERFEAASVVRTAQRASVCRGRRRKQKGVILLQSSVKGMEYRCQRVTSGTRLNRDAIAVESGRQDAY